MFQNHKTTGKVIIQHSERTELFNVTVIHDNDEKNPVIIESVEMGILVSVIDENVEKTEGYEKRISEEYHIIEL